MIDTLSVVRFDFKNRKKEKFLDTHDDIQTVSVNYKHTMIAYSVKQDKKRFNHSFVILDIITGDVLYRGKHTPTYIKWAPDRNLVTFNDNVSGLNNTSKVYQVEYDVDNKILTRMSTKNIKEFEIQYQVLWSKNCNCFIYSYSPYNIKILDIHSLTIILLNIHNLNHLIKRFVNDSKNTNSNIFLTRNWTN